MENEVVTQVVVKYPEGFNLTAADLKKKLEDSHEFMGKVTSGFAERNERLLHRKPNLNGNGQMNYDELVDNTLPSYLERMPKNVIQKLPTFTVDARTRWKAEDLVYEYICVDILLKTGSSKGYGLLQKQWIELRNAATFGACAVYLPFEDDEGEYTVSEVPIYWGDIYPEAWSTNFNSNNFNQFRMMKTEADIEKIRDGGDDELGGTFIPGAAQLILDHGTGQNSGKEVTNTKASMDGLPDHMYELFKYVDRDWIVDWHYASETILRVIPNNSRRRRIVGLYSDYDGSSIMGRSLVDMGYGAQMSLTSLLRNFIYTSDYNTDPAKMVKGVNLDEDSFNLTKGNTMFLNDEEGSVELLPVDTTTLQNFPALYNLLKTVLLSSLPASSDTSIPAGSGDPGYSKTQAGVNDQREKSDVDNNYYRKNYETYFEMTLENKLNIYLAEVKAICDKNNAVPLITLNEEYANLVRENLPPDQKFINAQNQVRLDLSDFRGANISVNFESTQELAKEQDLKRLNTFLTGFFELAKSDPSMAKVMRSVMPLLIKEMTKSSNLENSAKIAQVMEEALKQVQVDEKAAAEAEAKLEQQKTQAMQDAKAPTVAVAFKDLPPAGKIQAAAQRGITLTAADVARPVVPEKGVTPVQPKVGV